MYTYHYSHSDCDDYGDAAVVDGDDDVDVDCCYYDDAVDVAAVD